MEAQLPKPNRNNIWYHQGTGDTVIVFVHGIFSDSRSCWFDKESGAYWPALVRADSRFGDAGIYLGGYKTELDAQDYSISDAASELWRALKRPGNTTRPVIDHDSPGSNPRRLVFVCHSTGGIVVRKLLVDHLTELQGLDAVSVLLIASPTRGSVWAKLGKDIATFYGAKAPQSLAGGELLDLLEENFRTLVNKHRHPMLPELHGAEAYENRFIYHFKWFPIRWRVVAKSSAAVGFWGNPTNLAGCDHFSSVKPNDGDHVAHLFLVDSWNEFVRATGGRSGIGTWSTGARNGPELQQPLSSESNVETKGDSQDPSDPPEATSKLWPWILVPAVAMLLFLGLRQDPPAPEVEMSACGFYRDQPSPDGTWEQYSPNRHGLERFWMSCAVRAHTNVILSSVLTARGRHERFFVGDEDKIAVEQHLLRAYQRTVVAVPVERSEAASAIRALSTPSHLMLELVDGQTVKARLPILSKPLESGAPTETDNDLRRPPGVVTRRPQDDPSPMPIQAPDSPWLQLTDRADWDKRYSPCLVAHGGAFFLMGGHTGTNSPGTWRNDVWRSVDGAQWNLVTSAAQWQARVGHACVSFNGYIYLLGGKTHVPQATLEFHDVWRSRDGQDWEQVHNGRWAPREYHGAVVHGDRLFVLGGSAMQASSEGNSSRSSGSSASFRSGQEFRQTALNDIWSTSDGLSWKEHQPPTHWSPRWGHGVASHGGALWVAGGISDLKFRNDVWKSIDGNNWELVNSYAAWSERAHFGFFALDGRLWVLGGSHLEVSAGTLLDTSLVWSSENGLDWEEGAVPPWSHRAHTAVAVRGDVALMAAGAGCSGYCNDVYAFRSSSRELGQGDGIRGLGSLLSAETMREGQVIPP